MMRSFPMHVLLISLIMLKSSLATTCTTDTGWSDYAFCSESAMSSSSVLSRSRRSFTPYRTGKRLASQASNALDTLLSSGYDKRVRPNVGGSPVSVTINLSVRSMGPVDENREAFSLDCYFRQTWVDARLSFNSSEFSELVLNWAFLAKIWVPDTFIVNGKKSYLHKITVPNRFVRVAPDGRLSYSQRLTIWADCPMDLKKFPLDTQICPLHVSSFGYDARDIVYRWARPTAVSFDALGMAQFHLKSHRIKESIDVGNRRTKSGFRNDSMASIEFVLERQTGFYMLQIYTPLTLIVFCSWVAFFLVKTEKGGEVPARTVLGANAVLAVVNIGFGGRSRPSVGYATAMDVFIILCFVTVFAALMEFACINFLDTSMKRRRRLEEERQQEREARQERLRARVRNMLMAALPIVDATSHLDVDAIALAEEESEEKNNEKSNKDNDNNAHNANRNDNESNNKNDAKNNKAINNESNNKEESLIDINEETEDDDNCEDEMDEEIRLKATFGERISKLWSSFMNWLLSKMENYVESRWGPLTEMRIYTHTTDVILGIDACSRFGFPFVFLLLQLAYWIGYLYVL